MFSEDPVEETERTVWNLDGTGLVYSVVERELDSFYYMEGNCVFQSTVWLSVKLSVDYGGDAGYINWKRILDRSKAFSTSERSIVLSILQIYS